MGQALAVAAGAKSLQSCLTLCDPRHGSPSGSTVLGILQARTLEWVAISFSNACTYAKLLQSCPTLCDPMDSSPPGCSIHRILLARILEVKSEVTQSCPTPCDSMDCSLPGSSVHGIFQARILEWVAIFPSGDLPSPGIKPSFPVVFISYTHKSKFLFLNPVSFEGLCLKIISIKIEL